MRRIERESSHIIYMYNYEDHTYFIDTEKDEYSSVLDKSYLLLDYTDDELEVFMKSIDNGLVDHWNEITEIK